MNGQIKLAQTTKQKTPEVTSSRGLLLSVVDRYKREKIKLLHKQLGITLLLMSTNTFSSATETLNSTNQEKVNNYSNAFISKNKRRRKTFLNEN